MNIRHLSIFQSVMRTQSATSAAVLNGVSQSAVSQVLKQLEHDLRLPLFVRMKGRLTPTPEAHRVAREVDTILASMDALHGVVDEILDRGSGTVTIATLTYAHVFLPGALGRLQELAPGVKVAIHVLPMRSIVEMVAQGGADIGIVTDAADPQLTRYKDLRSLDVIAVLPKSSPLAERSIIRPADLRGQRIMSYDPQSPFGEKASRAFAAENERYEVGLHVASSTLLCALVEQNLGVALLEPFILLGPDRFDVVARPFRPMIPMKTRLLFSASRPLSLVAKLFQQTFENTVADMTHAATRLAAASVAEPPREVHQTMPQITP